MAAIKNYEQFIKGVSNRNFAPYVKRFQELAGISSETKKKTYLIEITFDFSDLIIEHNAIKDFNKTKNRYYYHTEETNPPVKAHYHIIPSNSKKEIYAVNVDGTSHHRKNKGFEIPKKEANELRDLGVEINTDNIIENIKFLPADENQLILESLNRDCVTIYIEIEE